MGRRGNEKIVGGGGGGGGNEIIARVGRGGRGE